jgi:hypothetical protein
VISSLVSSLKKLDRKYKFASNDKYLGIGTIKGDEEAEATSDFIKKIAERLNIPVVVGDISKLQTSYSW